MNPAFVTGRGFATKLHACVLRASVAARLIELRESRALSVSHLARRSGVPRATIQEIERARYGLKVETAYRLAVFYGVSISAILPDWR